jgi:protein phosphatase
VSEDFVCAVVCDGVGGSNGGGIASNLVIDTVKEEVSNIFDTDKKNDLEALKAFLFDTAKKANEVILETSRANENLKNMGTTMVLVAIIGDVLQLVYAGDSRAYLMSKNDNSIKQITKDHSLVQEMVDAGHITDEQAKDHPLKNIITRSLGMDMNNKFDYIKTSFSDNTALLICTDGLTNSLSDKEIFDVFLDAPDIEKFVSNTMNLAKKLGGQDDITILAVDE